MMHGQSKVVDEWEGLLVDHHRLEVVLVVGCIQLLRVDIREDIVEDILLGIILGRM